MTATSSPLPYRLFTLLFTEDAGPNNIHHGKIVKIMPNQHLECGNLYSVRTMDGYTIRDVFANELHPLSPEASLRYMNERELAASHMSVAKATWFDYALITGTVLFIGGLMLYSAIY